MWVSNHQSNSTYSRQKVLIIKLGITESQIVSILKETEGGCTVRLTCRLYGITPLSQFQLNSRVLAFCLGQEETGSRKFRN
jgi:hypothetical protein